MSGPKKPNDRLGAGSPARGDEDPRIFLLLDRRKFPRPGLDTYFAEAGGAPADPGDACKAHSLSGSYCSCNKVCACVPVCGCVSHTSCSCVGYTCGCVGNTCYGGGGGGYGCSCAPVH